MCVLPTRKDGLYLVKYFHVSAPSKVRTLTPAISAGDIILALTAIRLSADFAVAS